MIKLTKMTLNSIIALEENSSECYLELTTLIVKILDGIIKYPYVSTNRHINLSDDKVSNKLLSGIGAMECLFELGFQEGDYSLILPFHASLDELIDHRNEIAIRRNSYLERKLQIRDGHSTHLHLSIGPLNMNPLMKQIFYYYNFVLEYENLELQKEARQCIPLGELELAAEKKLRKIQLMSKLNKKEESVTIRDLLLMELVSWFKNCFFTWVDSPNCARCKGPTKYLKMCNTSSDPSKGGRTELYSCEPCGGFTTPFHRYNDPWKLLQTREGRCGEWALCFTLICRSLGYEARLVYDVTDHLWTEVYRLSENPRWIHVDPCEEVVDAPLIYECGWGKQLSHVLSFSVDGVQDVTWRYSQIPPEEILLRRQESGLSEEELIAAILKLRQERYKDFSAAKRKYFLRRTVAELAEFLWMQGKETQIKDEEQRGRLSGSLAWRMTRGEVGSDPESFVPHVWKLSKDEEKVNDLIIKYSSASDKYVRIVGNRKSEIEGWRSGLFENVSVFRKEEKDWKMAYLAREEGSKEGSIKFKVDMYSSQLAVNTVSVLCKSTVFETGSVQCIFCGGDFCLRIPTGDDVKPFMVSSLEGIQAFTLEIKLSGGRGPVAWQHAQLFRQSLNDREQFSLEIHIKLKRQTI